MLKITLEMEAGSQSIVTEQTKHNDNRTGDGVQCYPVAGALLSPTFQRLGFTCKGSTGLPPGSFRILTFVLLNLKFLVYKYPRFQRLFTLGFQFLSSL